MTDRPNLTGGLPMLEGDVDHTDGTEHDDNKQATDSFACWQKKYILETEYGLDGLNVW